MNPERTLLNRESWPEPKGNAVASAKVSRSSGNDNWVVSVFYHGQRSGQEYNFISLLEVFLYLYADFQVHPRDVIIDAPRTLEFELESGWYRSGCPAECGQYAATYNGFRYRQRIGEEVLAVYEPDPGHKRIVEGVLAAIEAPEKKV